MIRSAIFAFFLLVLPATGEAKWREASSRHFVIYSEASEEDLRDYADQLERFDQALRLQLRRVDPDRSPATRLTIYVLPNLTKLQDVLGSGSGVAGVYFGRASGSMAFTFRESRRRSRLFTGSRSERRLDPQTVLFHEYTHHFLMNNFAFGAPLWFSEGYPEFWSTAEVEEDGSVKFGLPALHRQNVLTMARPVPAEELLTLRHPIRDRETIAVLYGRGWLLTHYLVFDPSRAGQLDAYLMALAEGRSPAEAATVFGNLDELERELREYFDRPQFSYATIPGDRINPGPIAIRELTPAEEAVIEVKMRSKRGVSRDGARRLVRSARRAAAPFPNDPAAQIMLAEAEHDAGNYAEAEAAADRALAANPNMVDAHLYKARAIWGRLEEAEDASDEDWQEVQKWIGSANRLDPDDPEPLVLFYQSFTAAGWPLTQNAVAGLLYAHEIAPEDRSLRISAARQLLGAGNAPAARLALATLAGDPHTGKLGEKVTEVIAMLDTGDTAAALAKLDAALTESDEED